MIIPTDDSMDSKGKAAPPNAQYPPSSSDDSDSDTEEEDAQLLVDTYLPQYHAERPPMYEGPPILPLCIPQTGTNATAPFARGYHPGIGISMEEFVGFVDGLNVAMTNSPPLRIVDMAGQIIGFVPYHWAMIAGAAMQASAQTAMKVLSKTLTDRYLRSANERVFHPRGLSARICTTPAALKLTSSPGTKGEGGKEEGPSKMDKFGRAVGGALLHLPLPLSKKLIHAVADKPPPIAPAMYGESSTMTLVRRRMALVEGKALGPVQFEGLPAPVRTGFMEKMNAYGVEMDEKKQEKKQRKVEAKRIELAAIQSHSGGGDPSSSSSLQQQQMYTEPDRRMGGGFSGLRGHRDGRGGMGSAPVHPLYQQQYYSPPMESGRRMGGLRGLRDRRHGGGVVESAIPPPQQQQQMYYEPDRRMGGGLSALRSRRDHRGGGGSPQMYNVGTPQMYNPGDSTQMHNPGSSPQMYNMGGSPQMYNPGGSPQMYNAVSSPQMQYQSTGDRREDRRAGRMGRNRGSGRKTDRLQRRVADADLLEHWKNADVLWIVVMDRKFDQDIDGVAKADSQANEEQVDDRTWREELEYEHKVDQKVQNEHN